MQKVSVFDAVKFSLRIFFINKFFYIATALISAYYIFLSYSYKIVFDFFVRRFPRFGIIVDLLKDLPNKKVLETLKSDHVAAEAFAATIVQGLPRFIGILGLILIIYLLLWLIYEYIWLGIIKSSVDFYDQGSSSCSAFLISLFKFIRFVIASIIYLLFVFGMALICLTVVISVGIIFKSHNLTTILALILGPISLIFMIYFSLKFWFFPYFIVDKNAGIIGSLSQSFRLKGGPSKVFVLLVIGFFLRLISRFFVGILTENLIMPISSVITVIISFLYILSGAYLYRNLTSKG